MRLRAQPMKLQTLVAGPILFVLIGPMLAIPPHTVVAADSAPTFDVRAAAGDFAEIHESSTAVEAHRNSGPIVQGPVSSNDLADAMAGPNGLGALAGGSIAFSATATFLPTVVLEPNAQAEMFLRDVVITPPAGIASGSLAPVSLNLSVHSSMKALTHVSGPFLGTLGAGAHGSIDGGLGTFFGGTLLFGGRIDCCTNPDGTGLTGTGIFDGFSGTGDVTTGQAMVPVDTPLTLRLTLYVSTAVFLQFAQAGTCPGWETGTQVCVVGNADAVADFINTVTFPKSGSVFNLPTGYTVDSPSGKILNNHWTGGPAADTVPPTTTASLSPTANASSWNNSDVTVNLTSADDTGGSGVKEISTALTGSQTGSAVTRGSTASVTITEEGTTTLTFFGRDNAGNQETPHTVTIRIDKTVPMIAGSRLPLANADGWNNSDVTVHFDCTDALSGITRCSSDVGLASEGVNQAVIGSASDRAGNTTTSTVGNINIDKTPPLTVATANPPANANGWNQTPVQITLAATDVLSSVLGTEFNLDGVGFVPYTAPLSVSGDGVHGLEFRSTDRAGNVEATESLAVKIDQTAPEASFQFDPGANDIAVFGRDALSGPSQSGRFAPISVVQSGADEEGDGQGGPGRDAHRGARWELRTYRVTDQAGNALTLTLRVRRQEKGVSVGVVRLEYNGGPALIPIHNDAHFRADLDRSGELRRVEQEIALEADKLDETVRAVWDARPNQTRITVERDDREIQTVRDGLVLLRLATSKGTLKIEF